MKRRTRILIFLIAMLLPYLGKCQLKEAARSKLIGKHWSGSCLRMSCDTMEFFAFKKYESKRYQWASGYAEGMEFYENDSALTFHNVLCSDESSPVDMPSRWALSHDTLTINGYSTRKYRVLTLSRKKLVMLVIN